DVLANTQFNISVTDNIDPVDVGTAFEYAVSIENTGATALNFVEFELLIPVELNQNYFVAGTNFSCSNTSSNVIHCISTTGFSLNAGTMINALTANVQSNSYTGSVFAKVNALDGVTIIKTNTEQTEIAAVTPNNQDVSILKTANVGDIEVGEEFVYELSVSNNDTQSAATGINVSDDLSQAGVTLVSIDAPSVFNCSGTTVVSCTATQLQASETQVIKLTVKAPNQTGTINNTATVVTDSVDNDASNNSSQVSVNVTSAPAVVADVAIEKTVVANVDSGENLQWMLKIHNNGPDAASNIVVQDILPVGFTFGAVNNSACTNANSTVTCNFTSLANGEDIVLEISGQVDLEQGQLSNTATILSTTSIDNNNDNDESTAQVIVNPVSQQVADLYVDIESNNGSVMNQGDTLNFIMHAKNLGPDSANKPKLQATITGILKSVAVEENGDWSCQINGFNIACEFNGEQMPNNYHMPLGFTVVTDRVVQTSEDLTIVANISSTTTDNDLANNTSTFNAELISSPSEDDILSAMQQALSGIGSKQTQRAIQNVASYCARRYFWALEGMCDDLYAAALAGEGETLNKVMQEITPSEVIGQSTSVTEIANAQFRNVGTRLAEIRGGRGSGFSASGLTATMGNGGIPLTMLSYLNKSNESADGFSKNNNDFVSPWGFFINGTISMGKRDATGRELSFDFDSFGLTAGFDYRISSKHVLGVALGYANFDSQIDNDSAKLKSTGLTLTAYGSFNITDNFYMDARISYGKPDFKQTRNINFTLNNVTIDRVATGETSANQYSVAMSAGYTFSKKAWNITPNGSVRYAKTRINGFRETGAGDFNFIFANQTYDSLLWSAGVRVSKAISLKNGVITPQLDFDYNYESLNDGTNIEARFIEAPDDEIFIIETDSPDRTYGSAGLGIVYISANGKQAYINYRSTIGLKGFTQGTFNLGARFEF
ncbi:MAG TPA: autotransporter domain-containing protein, partial [Oceanospirillales bacterium]|nr:autotransporter domain-containing protein [Oceanospirillales bacterium]